MSELQELEPVVGLQRDTKQEEAIAACCDPDQRIVAVSGEAGTGKTRIIKEVATKLMAAGYLVACSAPTGKAAKRIKESTGLHAVTNHRLLGYGQPLEHEETDEKTGKKNIVKLSTGPTYDRKHPLPFDFILCDEYAMVNNEIHRSLIDALKPGARVRMFGDTNQLKPIEEDKQLAQSLSPFQIALTKFTGIVLEKNYRQIEGSGVIEGARRILLGRTPLRATDFNLFYTDEPVKKLTEWLMDQKDAGVDYFTPDNQVITCMNKSWIGTKKLNLTLQSLVWERDEPYLALDRHKWEGEDATIRVQVGTKVVYTANTYDLGNEQSVFNGEVGMVMAINTDEGSVDIDLGDRVITVPPVLIVVRNNGQVIETDPRKNIDLAYCLTTHKMQGSEVKNVTYIVNKSTIYGQSRRNFYTAVSRARDTCTVIADQHSMAKSVQWNG